MQPPLHRRASALALLVSMLLPLAAHADAPPATLPDPAADRLTFLTLQLSSVEVSLSAVNVALRGAGYKVVLTSEKAGEAAKGNELMDRNGGAPIAWDKFYGKTARQFAPRDILGTPHNYGRPSQFNYLYRANNEQIAKANDEISTIGKKIDLLLARRRQLDAEQSALWATISWESLENRDIAINPLYRFQLKAAAASPAANAHRDLLRPAILFLRTIDQTVADDLNTLHANQDQTLTDLADRTQAAYAAAKESLANAMLAPNVSPEDLKSAKELLASLRHIDELSKNTIEAYHLALDGESANDDARKLTFRAQLQFALLDYTTATADLDDQLANLAKSWGIEGEPGIASPDHLPPHLTRISAVKSDDTHSPAGLPASAHALTNAPPAQNSLAAPRKLDLLPLIDTAHDTVGGGWALRDGKLTCQAGNDTLVELPYIPAGDYDLRVGFTITGGGKGLNIFGTTPSGQFAWGLGIGGKYSGIRNVNGHDVIESSNPSSLNTGPVLHNHSYTVLLKVRGTSIQVFLDDKSVTQLDTASNRVVFPKDFPVRNKTALGICAKKVDLTITSIELTDLFGQGTLLHPAPSPH